MSHSQPPKAPNLVLPSTDYGISNESQFRNQLRLYFNLLDTANQDILSSNGGYHIDFPKIEASYSADQTTTDNTATKVLWDTAGVLSGFTLNANSTATALYNGVYKIDYGLQVANTNNVIQELDVWLQIDGVDVPKSGVTFDLTARKSAIIPSYLLAYSSFVFEIEAGQSVGLYWATDQAYIVGTQDGVYLQYSPAQASPFARPSIPSAIGSITYVGRGA
jgi:hypothetical protein